MKQLRFGFIRQKTVSHSLSALYVLFCKLQPCLRVSFTEGRLLSSHTAIKRRWWSIAVMVVFLEVSPVITQDLWTSARVTIGFLVTSFAKAVLLRFAKFSQTASSLGVLVVPDLLPGSQALEELRLFQISSTSELWSLLGSWGLSLQKRALRVTQKWLFSSPDLCLETVPSLQTVPLWLGF